MTHLTQLLCDMLTLVLYIFTTNKCIAKNLPIWEQFHQHHWFIIILIG